METFVASGTCDRYINHWQSRTAQSLYYAKIFNLFIYFFLLSVITCPPISTCRILTACGLLVLRIYFNQLFVSWEASNHPLTPLPAVRTWKKSFSHDVPLKKTLPIGHSFFFFFSLFFSNVIAPDIIILTLRETRFFQVSLGINKYLSKCQTGQCTCGK